MDDERRAIARLGRWILLLAIAGAVAAAWRGGPRGVLGFLVGAAVSYWNFRALKRIVERLSGAGPQCRGAVRVVLRFLLIGLGAFVILNYSELSVTAALIGLFVSAAAVILEILFELCFHKSP